MCVLSTNLNLPAITRSSWIVGFVAVGTAIVHTLLGVPAVADAPAPCFFTLVLRKGGGGCPTALFESILKPFCTSPYLFSPRPRLFSRPRRPRQPVRQHPSGEQSTYNPPGLARDSPHIRDFPHIRDSPHIHVPCLAAPISRTTVKRMSPNRAVERSRSRDLSTMRVRLHACPPTAMPLYAATKMSASVAANLPKAQQTSLAHTRTKHPCCLGPGQQNCTAAKLPSYSCRMSFGRLDKATRRGGP